MRCPFPLNDWFAGIPSLVQILKRVATLDRVVLEGNDLRVYDAGEEFEYSGLELSPGLGQGADEGVVQKTQIV